MNYGFVKVAAATPQIKVADCTFNGEQILHCMEEAARQGAKVLVFPELCLTGYTCGDLFLQQALLNAAEQALLKLAEQTQEMELLCLVGFPLRQGSALYNCAAVLYRGQILGFVPKENIPNYGEFYELRHFTPAPAQNGEVTFGGKQVPFGSRLIFC